MRVADSFKKIFPMKGNEESTEVLKNVDWKTVGNAVTNRTNEAVPKKRISETRFRQIPEYYFLPKRSVPYVIAVYGTIIAAGIGAGMVIENWINKKIQGMNDMIPL